ncbi:hypothetical protein [Paraburkholderia sediminicola]|uniref:hypothetical protein n=1 Tax=Paraburkholderia sediminicola TaxID=458836 RepID=UPI0038B913C3
MATKPKKTHSRLKPVVPEKEPDEPWKTTNVHPKGFTTQFDAVTHSKMAWITENVPKMSIRKIVHAAVAHYLERTLAELHKP